MPQPGQEKHPELKTPREHFMEILDDLCQNVEGVAKRREMLLLIPDLMDKVEEGLIMDAIVQGKGVVNSITDVGSDSIAFVYNSGWALASRSTWRPARISSCGFTAARWTENAKRVSARKPDGLLALCVSLARNFSHSEGPDQVRSECWPLGQPGGLRGLRGHVACVAPRGLAFHVSAFGMNRVAQSGIACWYCKFPCKPGWRDPKRPEMGAKPTSPSACARKFGGAACKSGSTSCWGKIPTGKGTSFTVAKFRDRSVGANAKPKQVTMWQKHNGSSSV